MSSRSVTPRKSEEPIRSGAVRSCNDHHQAQRLSQRHLGCWRASNLIREVGQRAPVPAFARRALQVEGDLANLPAQVLHLVTSGEDFQVVFRPAADLLSRCFCRGNTRGGDSCGNRSPQRCDVVPGRVPDADERDGPHSGCRKRIPASTADQQALVPSKEDKRLPQMATFGHLPPHQPLIQELTASLQQGNRRSHRWPGRAIELPRSA
jgi:hypothetical protein